MPRPSPRTEGGGYGTQQLDFVAGKPPQVGTPYQGVVVKPSFVGFSGFVQNIIPRGTFGTPSAQPHSNPNVVTSGGTYISPPIEATGAGTTGNGNGKGSDKCQECDAWDVGCELTHWFGGTCTPPEKPPNDDDNGTGCDVGCLLTGRGCDCGCKDMKPCTTCDSDVCEECNAWDLQCEDCHKKNGTCTTPPPEKTNWFWAKIILVIIGIGVFLWLLRPLFSRGGQRPSGIALTPI